MNLLETKFKLEQQFIQKTAAGPCVYNAYLKVFSAKYAVDWEMAAGSTNGVVADPGQPWHTASIGKTFTAVIIMMLVEQGRISLEDPLVRYLPASLTQGLHVYKGRDYTADITIAHLLSHTSGLPDFYEDKPGNGPYFLQLLLEVPDRLWTPEETVSWTKLHIDPLFPPGEKLHYTDTGYNLLGLVIAAVTGKPYEKVLHEFIFEPLGMQHSYLLQYSTPAVSSLYPVASVFLRRKEIRVEEYRSFSSIYASGQTISTAGDLIIFMQALTTGRLISQASLEKMMVWRKTWTGVDYGMGLMRVRMHMFTRKYDVWGHLGSTGSFMLFNPVFDIYIAGSFNRSGFLTRGVMFVYRVLKAITKIK
ncbi:serine hydrolase [Chitinophaga sp. HK235]|uniref:serine hydrolase domain-containing protein n=1 Tax=Chitinophaga sp. HK235 TaxID=2952571 RepID=UPI001BA639DE|nr:serine hydrolase domain-containing protein [Chitinophaga sp. HK235]